MPEPAPIALFVYDRPDHARATLEALSRNRQAEASRLVIFADGPSETATEAQRERIAKVRDLIRRRKWCGDVALHE